jgi:hypothetical protein
MSDKAKLLQDADDTFAELRHAIDGLTEGQMRQAWLGTWGVREIAAHVSGWHEAMIPALQRIALGEAPYAAGTYDDFDAWNARFVEQRSGLSAAEIVARMEASHRDFVEAAAAVPEPHFTAGGAARDLVDGVGPGHYREHAAQIREWRAGAAR